jgi:hypothetical protein
MTYRSVGAALALVVGLVFAFPIASASAAGLPVTNAVQLVQSQPASAIHKVHGRHCGWRRGHRHRWACGWRWRRCKRVRRRCAHRWGWGTWRYHRCRVNRGC